MDDDSLATLKRARQEENSRELGSRMTLMDDGKWCVQWLLRRWDEEFWSDKYAIEHVSRICALVLQFPVSQFFVQARMNKVHYPDQKPRGPDGTAPCRGIFASLLWHTEPPEPAPGTAPVTEAPPDSLEGVVERLGDVEEKANRLAKLCENTAVALRDLGTSYTKRQDAIDDLFRQTAKSQQFLDMDERVEELEKAIAPQAKTTRKKTQKKRR
jgi:hypothetical protein